MTWPSAGLPGFPIGVHAIVMADADDAITSNNSRLEHRRGIALPGGAIVCEPAPGVEGAFSAGSALSARPAPAPDAEQPRDHEQAGAGFGCNDLYIHIAVDGSKMCERAQRAIADEYVAEGRSDHQRSLRRDVNVQQACHRI